MRKSTKIIATVVAMALVLTAMVVGIYAATSGSAAISASVNWSATAGIEFTLDGSVANGKTQDAKSITQVVVTSATSNADITNKNAGDLGINFYDGTDDGVNNPSNVTYTYTVKNTSSSVALKVTLTKMPATGNNVTVTVAGTNGSASATITEGTAITVQTNQTLTITFTLKVTDANSSVASFDAGVGFNFAK